MRNSFRLPTESPQKSPKSIKIHQLFWPSSLNTFTTSIKDYFYTHFSPDFIEIVKNIGLTWNPAFPQWLPLLTDQTKMEALLSLAPAQSSSPGHNLSKSQPSVSIFKQFPKSKFSRSSIYSHTTGGRKTPSPSPSHIAPPITQMTKKTEMTKNNFGGWQNVYMHENTKGNAGTCRGACRTLLQWVCTCLGNVGRCRETQGDAEPCSRGCVCISLCLPASPSISWHLPASPKHIHSHWSKILHLPASPCISLHLPASPCISLEFPSVPNQSPSKST